MIPDDNTSVVGADSEGSSLSHIILGLPLPMVLISQVEMDFSLPPQPPPRVVGQRQQHCLTAPSVSDVPPDFSLAFFNLWKKTAEALSSIISAENKAYSQVLLHADDQVK